jgi:hypothetical protein
LVFFQIISCILAKNCQFHCAWSITFYYRFTVGKIRDLWTPWNSLQVGVLPEFGGNHGHSNSICLIFTHWMQPSRY